MTKLASAGIVILVTAAGWSVWPDTKPPANAMALEAPFDRALALPASTPVFTLDDGFYSHQCGRLHRQPGAAALLAPYGDPACRERLASGLSVAYPADVRLLWALLTPAERDEIFS
ncbi:MAG: hypothetical protein K2X44_06270, partial [Magnetospirillum sp.]|nr:hypothetical protein [Magnetospirillum sp.]